MAGEVRRRLDAILDATFAAFPSQGRDLGLHAYDGLVDDLSPAALAGRAAERRRHLAELAATTTDDPQEADDRDHLVLRLAEEELLLARREEARRDPVWATLVLNVTPYFDGPPATRERRAVALRRHLEQVPDALAGLAGGLDEVPLAFREAAGDVLAGYASFYRTEAAPLAGEDVAERAAAAVERYAATVAALDGPPLEPWGAADFGELLRVRTGEPLDAAALLARGRAEADRQLALQQEAAARAGGGVAHVRAAAAGRAPGAGELVPLAEALVAECRRFVVDSGFVSLPDDEPPGVQLAPPYLRGATAFYHSPGPFEPAGEAAAFRRYHLTPPLPDWDPERTARWLGLFHQETLVVCTLHETYPGHHAHELHLGRAPSRVATALWNEVLGEGWAHYGEEAAFGAGFRAGDPAAEVAMRTDALVRVARLLCAAGMHTQGMTLDEATREFEQTAGLDPDHARLEAVRGTWDPGYFGYTLGKLKILDLRERVGGDPGAFHDRLLALGTPPPAVAARRLLGDPVSG